MFTVSTCRSLGVNVPLAARSFTRRRVARRKRITHYPPDVLAPNTADGTWLVRHAFPPPATALGGWQRAPRERQDFQVYELHEEPQADEQHNMLSVILTEYVEGVGNRGELVEVGRDYGRNELLLARRAVYASPHNMDKFERERQKLAEKGIIVKAVDKSTALFARDLSRTVVLVTMSLEQPWTIEPWHVRLCLRTQGYVVDETHMLLLPEAPISGPDMKLQDSLFRAYLVLDNQLVCPLTCRIHHVSADEAKQLVSGADEPLSTSERELRRNQMRPERVYVHLDDSLHDEQSVRRALTAAASASQQQEQ